MDSTEHRFGESAVYGPNAYGLRLYEQCNRAANEASKPLDSEKTLPKPAVQLSASRGIRDRRNTQAVGHITADFLVFRVLEICVWRKGLQILLFLLGP